MAKKMGLFSKLIVGTEKSEDYVKGTLPTNRIELFWDIIKGNVFKLFGVNILILVTFVPLIALLLFKSAYLSSLGQVGSYSQVVGIGYPAVPSFTGMNAQLALTADMRYLSLLPVAMAIASVGISGGAYVFRNLVWGEGVFVAMDFFRGVKKNYLSTLLISVLFSLWIVFLTFLADYATIMQAIKPNIAWVFIVSKVFIYLALAFVAIMTVYMISMTVTYELKFFALVKNAFLFTLSFFPLNLIMLALSFIPFALVLLGGIVAFIAIFLVFLFGFSYAFLLLTDYAHWMFDRYINTQLPKQYRNRAIYEKQRATDKDELDKYKAKKYFSALNSRPIKPIDDDIVIDELPTTFKREDLQRLSEQKEVMRKDHDEYVKEHINDERYVEAREYLKNQLSEEENERMLEITRLELEGKSTKQARKKFKNPKKKKK